MTDSTTRIAALCSDKSNSRLVLATLLVKAEAEVQALRLRGAGKPAPKVVARSNFAAQLDDRIVKRKVALAAFFKDNPQCRSATPDQLAPYVMQ